MLDLIIISYKLTINMSFAYQEYIPVDYTYNSCARFDLTASLVKFIWEN